MARHSHEHDFRQQLKAAGQRVTAIRLAVMEVLAHSRTALDAADVLTQVSKLDGSCVRGTPDADRVSIYRTLNMLVDSGIAHRIDPGDRTWRYSLTTHEHCGHGEHAKHDHDHPHIVCDRCGSVECLTDAVVTIQPRPGVKKKHTFRVQQQQVTLHGLCEKCDAAPALHGRAT